MILLNSRIFKPFPEVIFGFSTKAGAGREEPYYFNMSFSVGDDEIKVRENRALFFSALGLSSDRIAYQKQVHGDTVTIVEHAGDAGESDAMITNKKGIGLAVSTADCTPVFVFDKVNKVIAGIHSGWRSTQKRIVEKTLIKMKDVFNSQPENLVAYIGPSISRDNYEVGAEVAQLFDSKYVSPRYEKFSLDVAGANYDMLLKFGLDKRNIHKSSLCTFEMKYLLHSYRRDGQKSGRSLGIIALK